MTEQNLATMFKDFAEEIKRHRAELISIVPEAEKLCSGLDELTKYLEDQSHALLAEDGERFSALKRP